MGEDPEEVAIIRDLIRGIWLGTSYVRNRITCLEYGAILLYQFERHLRRKQPVSSNPAI